MGKRIVVAFGGNAILQKGQVGSFEVQLANVYTACEQVAELVEQGYEVVLTHGNGPQVGAILLQNELAVASVPPMPLFVCGAESQGLIGLMIQQALGNILKRRKISRLVATVVTQVIVDPKDPAFKNPTKPIGKFYTAEEAAELQRTRNWVMKEDKTRGGWRRVVPSPTPLAISEKEAVLALLKNNAVVIASGGGGIPVVETENGLEGVDAVIDKDLAGQRLARDVAADIFVILTDVANAALNYGTPQQKNLTQVTLEEMKKHYDDGHFAAGSMGPKVKAAMTFVENGGEKAIITSLDKALEALNDKAGTIIRKQN